MLGDYAHGGSALEFWTPIGLVGALSVAQGYTCDKITPPHNSCFESVPYSTYHFEGVPEVLNDGFLPGSIRVNRRCQVLAPANLRAEAGRQWHAFIIGTPNDPGQCAAAQ